MGRGKPSRLKPMTKEAKDEKLLRNQRRNRAEKIASKQAKAVKDG